MQFQMRNPKSTNFPSSWIPKIPFYFREQKRLHFENVLEFPAVNTRIDDRVISYARSTPRKSTPSSVH